MGFFKRFLSLGSSKHRKNKKKQNASNTRVDAEGRILSERGAQDPDTSANRLLRSSSTKFSVMSAIDYTSLPPLPNSVQDLLNTPSLSPSPSLVTVATTPGLPRSGTPGLQRSGTYVVKVHSRTTHSRTEFPRANPPISPTKPGRKQPPPLGHSTDTELDSCSNHDEEDEDRQPRLKEVNFTPKDTSRLYKLRRDPSVASLLNLYDDRGCLDSAIFENSPPTPAPISAFQEGREPNKRSGSTLRQLLGATETAFFNNTAEGDISWAERFLDEQLPDDSPLSSPSTTDLQTPKDALFPDALSAPRVVAPDTTVSSLDPDSSANYPAFSSMEVEVSGSEEDVPVLDVVPVSKLPVPDPKTPQRASEVFGFLSRRNTLTVKERDLPPLPQIVTPETTGDTPSIQNDSNANDNDNSLVEHLDATPSANSSHSTQLTSSDTNSHASHAQIQTATMTKLSSAFAASTTSLNLLISQDRDEAPETSKPACTLDEAHPGPTWTTSSSGHAESHRTGSSLSSSSSMKVPPSKIPRGPRPRPHPACRRDSPSPEMLQAEAPRPDASTGMHQCTSSDENTRPSKREALAHILQRQHRRVTSRSSAHNKDSAALNSSLPSSKSGPHNRKRSARPEQFALGKENTPSPPSAPRRAEYEIESSIPMLNAGFTTPARHRVLIQPPSPASSSELSPIAREMMNDLRQQRMRMRQAERRQGLRA